MKSFSRPLFNNIIYLGYLRSQTALNIDPVLTNFTKSDPREPMANEFKKALKGVDKAIKKATTRALNRALDSGKAKMGKALRAETGLPNKTLNKRLILKRANDKKSRVKLFYGISAGISLGEFKPKVKAVRATHKNHRKGSKTKHYGVTVKIGKGARTLVPGGFVRTVKSGKTLVLARKGEARRPTVAIRTGIFKDSVKANAASTDTHMMAEFNRIVHGYIEFEISKKLGKR